MTTQHQSRAHAAGLLSFGVLALTGLFLLTACGSSGVRPPAAVVDEEEYNPFNPDLMPPEIYRIRSGDGISVRFLYNQELDVPAMQVREDGNVSLPVIGDVPAAGKTAAEVTEEVRTRFQTYVSQSGHGTMLKAGDELQIRFTYEPQLNQRIIVRPDGKASFLKIGELQVEGVSFSEFEKQLREAYGKFLRMPDMGVFLLNSRVRKIYADVGDITVLVTNPQPKRIFVGGEVGAPRLIEFRDWMTPMQAIAEAGGYKDSADGARVIYITRDAEGQALTTRINLDSYLQGGRKLNLYLRHGDVLFVPRSGIARLNLAVRQFIRDAMPLQTDAGFSYVLNAEEGGARNLVRINPDGE